MGKETTLRYTRLIGDTAKYPYLVGVFTRTAVASGILIEPQYVLTCGHLCNPNDLLQQYEPVTAIAASGPVEARVTYTDHQFDLALIQLNSPVEAPSMITADAQLRSQNEAD